jgi:hypothetical protein
MRRVLWSVTFALPVILLVPGTHAQAPAAPAQAAPAARPAPPPDPTVVGKDPNGYTLRLAKKTGHVSNYEEAKAGTYTLPDPLVKVRRHAREDSGRLEGPARRDPQDLRRGHLRPHTRERAEGALGRRQHG